jgi:hypothetical protein
MLFQARVFPDADMGFNALRQMFQAFEISLPGGYLSHFPWYYLSANMTPRYSRQDAGKD